MDMTDPQAIVCAIERQFRDPTSKSSARRLFNERKRREGEKLGVYAAELRHLARKSFPEFTEVQRFILLKEAFISGLKPDKLREQVQLSNPSSWEGALEVLQRSSRLTGTDLLEMWPDRSHSVPLP